MRETIGMIGLGRMGSAIAANLLAAGFGLRVYNRSPDKAKELVARGAVLCRNPNEAASAGAVVISAVADDRALQGICTDAFIDALKPSGTPSD